MNTTNDMIVDDETYCNDVSASSVSWAAIIGGAVAAASISLILLLLGSALGLSSLSPWSHPESVASVTVKTTIWLVVMQWLSSGFGGYIAGRLRTRWADLHGDEVLFRDTSHGFLSWAVATLLTATVLASAASAVVGKSAEATATVATGTAAGAAKSPLTDPDAYYIDSLYRGATPNTSASTADVRMETTRILAAGLKNDAVPDADKAYLTDLVAARTGLHHEEAAARVDNTIEALVDLKAKAKQEAEVARKTAMHVSLYIFLSLLVGAFIASSAAALGGQHRDEY